MKQLFKTMLNEAIISLGILCLSTSCQKEAVELFPERPHRLVIETTTQGFLPEDTVGTRAVTTTGATTFEVGDAIGVTAIKDGNIYDYDNVKFTYAGNGKWNGIDIYGSAGVTFIAYYPFRSDMSGKTSVDAIKSAFPIQSDQSTKNGFDNSNLLIATTDFFGGTLQFHFSPAFAMVQIDFSTEFEAYSSTNSFTYKIYGKDDAIVLSSSSLSFYKSGSAYRRIVKPSSTGTFNVVASLHNDAMKITCNNINIPALASGNYGTVAFSAFNRDQQIGDLVYNSGGELAFFPGNCSTVPQTDCIGVVYQIGAGKDDYPSNYGSKLSAIHGYAIALNNAGETIWAQSEDVVVGCSSHVTDFLGYSNTQKITSLPAGSMAINYTPSCPTTNCSGWYLPSVQQLNVFFQNLNLMNTFIRKGGGTQIFLPTYPDYYYMWSSSESTESSAIALERRTNNAFAYIGKRTTYPVRSSVTF